MTTGMTLRAALLVSSLGAVIGSDCVSSACSWVGEPALMEVDGEDTVIEVSLIQKDQQLIPGVAQDDFPHESSKLARPSADNLDYFSVVPSGKRKPVAEGELGARSAVIAAFTSLIAVFLAFAFVTQASGSRLSDVLFKPAKNNQMGALALAIQVTEWLVLMSIVFLVITRAKMTEAGFSPQTIVCNVLFIVGGNFGATAKNILYGFTGSFCASFTLWTMNGFMPGGYTAGKPVAIWYAGFAILMIYMAVFLFLNINGTIKFFALVNFVGFAMVFIDPASTSNVSTNFHITWTGAAVNSLGLYVISAALALLFQSLPPRTAFTEAKTKAREIIAECFKLELALLEHYKQDRGSAEVYALKSEYQTLRSVLSEAQERLGEAWYESWFCAFFQGGIGNKSLAATGICLDTVDEILTLQEPLFDIVSREEFDDAHKKMMTEIAPPLKISLEKIEVLVNSALDVAEDGAVDQYEIEELREHVTAAETAMTNINKALQDTLRNKKGAYVTMEGTGEQFFVYTSLEVGTRAIKNVRLMLAPEELTTSRFGCGGCLEAFGCLKDLFNVDWPSIKWAARTMLQMQICYWLGYHGYCSDAVLADPNTTAACFLYPKDSNLAMYVVIFMSRDTSATFKSALDRITAVVLASVSGQLLYVLLGWCTLWGRLSAAAALFTVVTPALFMGFTGNAMGTRLAAISASFLMRPCSDAALTHREYSANYHGLIEIVLAVFIMGIVDCTLGEPRASLSAITDMTDASSVFQKLFKEVLQSPTKENAAKIDDVRAKLDAAKEGGDTAAGEPDLWHKPWRPVLHNEVHAYFSTLCGLLTNFISQVEGVRLQNECPNYNAVVNELTSNLDETVLLSNSILNRDPKQDDLFKKTSARSGGIQSLQKLISDMNTLAKKSPGGGGSTTEVDMSTKLSVIAETLNSMMLCIQERKVQIVLAKDT